MEKNEVHQKTSAMVVILFIIAILSVLGTIIKIASSSTAWAPLIISLILDALIVYWAYYARQRLAKKNLGGKRMADFALYALGVTFVIGLLVILP